jgi:hypothetical protein
MGLHMCNRVCFCSTLFRMTRMTRVATIYIHSENANARAGAERGASCLDYACAILRLTIVELPINTAHACVKV